MSNHRPPLDLVRLERNPAVLSIPEAAQLLHVGRHRAYQMVAEGTLPTLSYPTRKRVSLDAVIALVKQK